jgi:hypothetical protein
MFLTWYDDGMSGKKPEMPLPGFTFKQIPELNEKLFQDHKNDSLKKVLKDFNSTHERCMKIVKKHSDAELTTKKKYTWTGSTNLASYLASATSSHYVWANDLIKKFRKKNSL